MEEISEVGLVKEEEEFERVARENLQGFAVGGGSNSMSPSDEREAKRARMASPHAGLAEGEPGSSSPEIFQQGESKAKMGGFTNIGSALELESATSQQGLPFQRVQLQAEDIFIGNDQVRSENRQAREQPEQEQTGLAPSALRTWAEESLMVNTANREVAKGTEVVSLAEESTMEEIDPRDGAGVELRSDGNVYVNNGGGEIDKGRGNAAISAKRDECLGSGRDATELTTLREDGDNPGLIELPARNRSKATFEGSEDNHVANTQRGLDQEEDERQSRTLLKEKVTEMTAKVEEMEQQVAEVLRIRAAVMKNKMEGGRFGVSLKEHEKDRFGITSKRHRQFEAAKRESAHSKRMADLMRQFSTILRQITQHKWAWPFMQPVDVVALNLHDYFDVIKLPMDFGTIRDKMNNMKEGAGYRNVLEICEDVRLVFSNAMTYNQEGTDVHIMAKTLSEKFEEKWKAVLEPKLQEEEARRLQEQRESEAKEAAEVEAAEEAAAENLAHIVCRQLVDLEDQLEDLKLQATSRCRTMSVEEKRQLGYNLGRLPPGPLNRVIQIIAKKNPDFNAAAYEVEVDIDAQDPATLWQLHCYVQMVLNPKSNDASGQMPSISRRKASSMVAKHPKKHDNEM